MMNYPLSDTNWLCRTFGHRYGKMYLAGVIRQTCWLDGHTIPPFRKVKQERPPDDLTGYDPYLPDDQQPPGAQ